MRYLLDTNTVSALMRGEPGVALTLVTADRAFGRLRLTRENWLQEA